MQVHPGSLIFLETQLQFVQQPYFITEYNYAMCGLPSAIIAVEIIIPMLSNMNIKIIKSQLQQHGVTIFYDFNSHPSQKIIQNKKPSLIPYRGQ